MTTTVTTREELATAKKNKVDEIVVVGELADKLKKAKKISTIGTLGIAGLTGIMGVAAFSAPMTGGLSLVAATPAAAATGVSVAAIIAASTLGIALVLAVYNNYDEIDYSNGRLKLRKKKKSTA